MDQHMLKKFSTEPKVGKSSRPETDSLVQFADHVGLQKAAAEGRNFVFSPLSIRCALSLAAAGSKGPTLDQFLAFLGSRTVDDLNSTTEKLMASVRTTTAPKPDTEPKPTNQGEHILSANKSSMQKRKFEEMMANVPIDESHGPFVPDPNPNPCNYGPYKTHHPNPNPSPYNHCQRGSQVSFGPNPNYDHGLSLANKSFEEQLMASVPTPNKYGSYLSLANSLWIEKSLTLKPKFKEIASSSYGAEAKSIDFRSNVRITFSPSFFQRKNSGKYLSIRILDLIGGLIGFPLVNCSKQGFFILLVAVRKGTIRDFA